MTSYFDQVIAENKARREAQEASRHKDNRGHRDRKTYYRSRSRTRLLPFCGVDGEGGGVDQYGRQNYLLLRAGEFELFRRNRRLTTRECFDFILSLPRDRIYVGYFFGYDTTMMLRDVNRRTLVKMFAGTIKGYVYWDNYAIDYRPRQYLRIARYNRETRSVVPNTSRTIDEVGGFFQTSFVNTIKNWADEIGLTDKQLAQIIEGKDRREGFEQMSKAERSYCALECDLLARVMSAFRETCIGADIVPKRWRGAGWISGALHDMHKSPKRIEETRPQGLNISARRAYYGGRFEVTRVGHIAGPVYEYDINSAYPRAMLDLPCPHHTQWQEFFPGERPPAGSIYVAEITFAHKRGVPLCGFPHRYKHRLKWPMSGRGYYWSPEIDAAKMLGARITKLHGGWFAKRCCDCHPYEWIAGLYAKRKEIGAKTKGYPIKLGINGAYGKLAQRVGVATYRDPIAAGLITAICRATLMQAVAADPGACVMLATDGIYTTRPLALDIGSALGQWETKTHGAGIFVVQPGIYWDGDMTMRDKREQAPKTRGVPVARLLDKASEFEAAWGAYMAEIADIKEMDTAFLAGPPVVEVPIPTFIGVRLGLQRLDIRAAGKWITVNKHIRFEWFHKRRFDKWKNLGDHVLTYPYEGKPDFVSEYYDDEAPNETTGERQLHDEAAPDYPGWTVADDIVSEIYNPLSIDDSTDTSY